MANATQLKLSLARLKGKKATKLAGAATLKVAAPTVNLRFGGRFAGKRLRAGTYRVTITPLSATGATGTPVTYTLRLT